MTKDYYGTKRITAWKSANEDGDEGYAVKYADGYTSWSPVDVFEAAYQPITAMNYGHALQAMNEGHKVARTGWNGKGMWVALTPGSLFETKFAKEGHAAKHRADEIDAVATDGLIQVRLLPHIDMRTVDGSMVVGWLASQSDTQANDWQIV